MLTSELSQYVTIVEDITSLTKDDLMYYLNTEIPQTQIVNLLYDKLKEIPPRWIERIVSVIKEKTDQISPNDILALANKLVLEYQRTQSEFCKVEGSDFKITCPTLSLDRVVLSNENRRKLDMALASIVNSDLIYNIWGFSEIDHNVRSIINFYGPPGTGKTMCANAIAHELSMRTGKEYQLLSLNYSEIESMYVGEAPKKLERVFNFARDKNIVLFFDEADSFLGKRIQNVSQGSEQAINSLRSTMLIQLEKYTGVVIFATNLTSNYDSAFKTRFLAEINFPLPNKDVCIEIFLKNIPSKLYSYIIDGKFNNDDLQRLGYALEGLSGRDIKTVIWRTLLKHSLLEGDKHVFTYSDFIEEVNLYKKEKETTRDAIDLKGLSTSVTPASQDLAKRIGLDKEIEDNR